jgi:hypothetical protein
VGTGEPLSHMVIAHGSACAAGPAAVIPGGGPNLDNDKSQADSALVVVNSQCQG